jgi:hypothetical protein
MSTRRPYRAAGPEAKLPPCPPHLQGEARKEWRRMGRKLLEAGLVAEVRRGAEVAEGLPDAVGFEFQVRPAVGSAGKSCAGGRETRGFLQQLAGFRGVLHDSND